MTAYQTYCKPALAKALYSLKMDKIIHRAEGAYVYYRNKSGDDCRVLDLLGGYGAILLGHNPPRLVKQAIALLSQKIAIHNQFSIRNGAAQLAAELNPILKQQTGWNEDFMLAFTNSGAESIEVALKHAEFIRGQKLTRLQQELATAADKLRGTDPAEWKICAEDRDLLALDTCQSRANIDTAIKVFNTRQFSRPPVFVALKHAFHGKLTSSIQLTHGKMYRQPFHRFGLTVRFMTPAEIEQQLEALLQTENAWVYLPARESNHIILKRRPLPLVGAVLAEPVQGEGGVYCLTREQIRILHAARDKWQCPLIADEIQSGCGRCGSFLAGSQIGFKPDYIALSKALGGGIAKLGVVAIRKSAYATGFDIIQSSTFGEDDYSAMIALGYLRLLEQNDGKIYRRVKETGAFLKQKLEALKNEFPDIIADVRGKGLLLGVEFTDQSKADSHLLKTVAYQKMLGYLLTGHLLNEGGIRVAPPASAPNVIRLEPSIEITQEDIAHLIQALKNICLALRYQDAHFILRYLTRENETPAPGNAPRDYRAYYADGGFSKATGHDTRLKPTKVAFINHLISSDWLEHVEPSFAGVSLAATDRLLNRMVYDRRSAPFAPVRITSSNGSCVDFILYPLVITAARIEAMLANNDLEEIRAAIDERVITARNDGCKVAGLGMFTSIATNNAKSVKVPGINLTTGNALTVAIAADAIKKVCRDANNAAQCAAVVGAAGNIGSVYSSILAETVPKLILTGSHRKGSQNRLKRTADRIYEDCWHDLSTMSPHTITGIAAKLHKLAFVRQWLTNRSSRPASGIGRALREAIEEKYGQDPFIVVADRIEALQEADIILCTANAADAFIDTRLLKPNAVICDVAVPHNLSQEALANRPDIVCIRGGIVKTPNQESLDPRARAYLKEGQVYACMAETMLLGLEEYPGNYSYGNLRREQVHKILQMAKAHGFGLATIKNRNVDAMDDGRPLS